MSGGQAEPGLRLPLAYPLPAPVRARVPDPWAGIGQND